MMKEGSTKTQVIFPRPSAQAPDISIQWTYWPCRTPLAWMMVTVMLLAVLLWVTLITGKWHLGILATFATALVLWKNYLPVTYRIDREGILRSVLGWSWKLPWNEIVGLHIVSSGLQLQQRHSKAGLSQNAILIPWGLHEVEVRSCLLKLVPGLFDTDSPSHSNPV